MAARKKAGKADRYEAVLERIRKVHVPYARHKHPLWRGLMDGEFSRKQVAEFLRQASIIPLYNHLYHGPLYMTCPDPEWRSMIADVVYEEGTGRTHADGVPHWKLWLRLGNAFGISDKEMWNVDFCPEAVAYRAFFNRICSGPFLEGVSAHMLGSEAQVPGASGSVAGGLQKKFRLTDEQIAFYTVHDHADEEHSDIGRQLLMKFAKTDDDFERVVRAVSDMVKVSKVLYDGIHACVLRAR